jgi:AcrR family transcriptional regulator
MAYPAYLRERARELRVAKKLSINEIAERLALPKTTIYYWIRDLPLARARREMGWPDAARRKGNRAVQAKHRRLREDAYQQGLSEWDELVLVPTFRDFIVMYMAEGYKRSRHTASVCNSDPSIVAMAAGWLRRLSGRTPIVRVQYHVDQDREVLRSVWADATGVEPSAVQLHPKSNSGALRTRVWRCAYGVAAVTVHDTLLRARLQAWMDRVRREWG